jgi:multiple sugar transport system substrate-binding protein
MIRTRLIVGLSVIVALMITALGRQWPAQAQSAHSSTTLTMWVHSDPNYERIAKQFATEYHKKTGVTISLNFIPWAQGQAKLATAFAAHDAPDVIQGVASWLFTEKTKGQLSPVPHSISANFNKTIDSVSLVPVQYKGKDYGVPINVNIDAGPLFLYNKDLYAQNHVAPHWSSWNSYVKSLQKLTQASGSTVLRSGLEVYGADVVIQFLMYFLQDGGHLNPPGKATVTLNNKYGRAALQTMSDYLFKDNVDSTQQNAYEGIGSGTAASIYWGPWYTKLLDHDFPKLKYGWAHEPLKAGQKPFFPGTNVWSWMVPAQSKHTQAAWAFINWLNQKSQRLAMAKGTGEIPALKTLWSEPTVKNDPRWAPWFPYLKYQVPLLYQAPQDIYYNTLLDMVNSVLLKKSTIPAALAKAQSQINSQISGR